MPNVEELSGPIRAATERIRKACYVTDQEFEALIEAIAKAGATIEDVRRTLDRARIELRGDRKGKPKDDAND